MTLFEAVGKLLAEPGLKIGNASHRDDHWFSFDGNAITNHQGIPVEFVLGQPFSGLWHIVEECDPVEGIEREVQRLAEEKNVNFRKVPGSYRIEMQGCSTVYVTLFGDLDGPEYDKALKILNSGVFDD